MKTKKIIPITMIIMMIVIAMIPLSAAKVTLYKGMTHTDVGVAQQKLKDWGYYEGNVDNEFGQLTYDAVILFQQKNGLTADGIVGKETWEALGYTGSGGSYETSTGAGNNDFDLIAKMVMAEAEGEPYLGKVAVAAVMLNRKESPR